MFLLGGLIALHNCSSYGHLEIAALLIKYNTVVNAVDKWGYTSLMEASQKGRTQLCALLLAHGADPFMKNQEGQTALELASAEDVKSLLQDAMVSGQPLATVTPSTSSNYVNTSIVATPTMEIVTLPTGATMNLAIALPLNTSRTCLSPIQGAESNDGLEDEKSTTIDYSVDCSVSSFLSKLKLEHLNDLFEREQITIEILTEMGHEDLKQVGVTAYGYRHKILKGIATLKASTG